MAIGENLGETLEDDENVSDAKPAIISPPEENLVTLAHFQDAGFLYTDERETNWILFLARTLNSTIRLREVRSDGVIILWVSSPPSDSDITSVHNLTSLDAREMDLHNTECTLFIRSPRPLSQDSSKIKMGPSPPPPATVKWLVISIPFET